MRATERDKHIVPGTGIDRTLPIAIVASVLFHIALVGAVFWAQMFLPAVSTEPVDDTPVRIRMAQFNPQRSEPEDIVEANSEPDPVEIAPPIVEILPPENPQEIVVEVEDIAPVEILPTELADEREEAETPLLEIEPPPVQPRRQQRSPLPLPSLSSIRDSVATTVDARRREEQDNWYLDCDELEQKSELRRCQDSQQEYVIESVQEIQTFRRLIATLNAGMQKRHRLQKLIADAEFLETMIARGEVPEGLSDEILYGLREMIELNTNNRSRVREFYNDQVGGEMSRYMKRIMGYSF